MTISITKPTVGGSENTWGSTTNQALDDIVDVLNGNTASTPDLTEGSWKVGGTAVTASAAEINKLDGLTASTSELNKLDGLTATTTELNYTDGVTSNIQTQLNNISGVPAGAIILWSGSTASIPSGWVLCNGSNSTPDLRDRFVVGAGSSYAVDATGGSSTVSLTQANLPSHTHGVGTIATSSSGSHSHNFNVTVKQSGGSGGTSFANKLSQNEGSSSEVTIGSAGAHTHTMSGSTAATGGGTAHENRPPYYALAYIMKT